MGQAEPAGEVFGMAGLVGAGASPASGKTSAR